MLAGQQENQEGGIVKVPLGRCRLEGSFAQGKMAFVGGMGEELSTGTLVAVPSYRS